MAYVYRHIRLDRNEVFYVGIGSDKYYSRAYTKWGRNKLWKNVVNKTEYSVEILFDNIDWELACKKEIEFIKLYGRKDLKNGTLTNMTDGGQGALGTIKSEEHKKKISKTLKKIKHTAGIKKTSEHKRKISESLKNVYLEKLYDRDYERAKLLLG